MKKYFKIFSFLLLTILLLTNCTEDTATQSSNLDPVVHFTELSEGDVFYKGESVEIATEASDIDGEVLSVGFLINGEIKFVDEEEPFVYVWDTSEEEYGDHNIRAVVTDNDGGNRSEQVSVRLKAQYVIPESRNDGWETAFPAAVGIDSTLIMELLNILLVTENHLVHGIVIVKEGKLIFEHYFPGLTHPTLGQTPANFTVTKKHMLSSVTKSFTALMLAIAIDKGYISGLDEKVADYYPNLSYMSSGSKNDITLRHLVTMSSGLEWNESSVPFGHPDNDLTNMIAMAMNHTGDPVDYILGKNMAAQPGALFNYSGGNSNVLGNIIQIALGKRLDHFCNESLFEPLGITDASWYLLNQDFVYASGDISLLPRDLAKVGQMLLQNGEWNGQQILAEEWIDLFAEPVIPGEASETSGYSYGWWTSSYMYGENAYAAHGWGGQRLIVMPEHDMVVVLTGGSYYETTLFWPHEIMRSYILPSIN